MPRKPKSDIDPYWWGLHESEVQAVATERLGRELTEHELLKVADMFSDGTHWMEILEIAVDTVANWAPLEARIKEKQQDSKQCPKTS